MSSLKLFWIGVLIASVGVLLTPYIFPFNLFLNVIGGFMIGWFGAMWVVGKWLDPFYKDFKW